MKIEFNKSDRQRNAFQLKGSLLKRIRLVVSFIYRLHERTGEEKSFFVEYFCVIRR